MEYFEGKIFAFHDAIYIKQPNGLYYQLNGDKDYFKSFVRREILVEFVLLSDQVPVSWRGRVLSYDSKCPLHTAFMDDLYKLGRDQYSDVPLKMNNNYGYIGFNGLVKITARLRRRIITCAMIKNLQVF